MKNIILVLCLLLVNLSFSQKDTNPFLMKVFYSNVEENQYQANTSNFFGLEGLEKLKLLKSIKPTNNSEGKFPFYSNNKVLLKLKRSEKKGRIVEEMIATKQHKNSTKFVNQVVLKILQDKNIDCTDFISSVDFQRGRTNHFSENYTLEANKLMVAYQLKNGIEFQLGKDIFAYLNKMYKSELDIALFNTLNLFVINF